MGGELEKIDTILLSYRWNANSTSFKISRKTLMRYKAEAFEEQVLCDPKWHSFMIWSAGRDGKEFYKSLSPMMQRRVSSFCDIDPKRINTSIMINHTTRQVLPIVHWREVTSPFVACVALDRDPDFEKNLSELGMEEGKDYFHCV